MRMAELKAGWAILGNDGRRFGAVEHVGQNYILASRGGLSGNLYVPASHIANVENEVVYLNLAKSEADAMGWEQPPRDLDAPETSPESDLHRHV
ncbi:MAG TPA: DUF2171 domain-containing protein [Candidatus Limnocylindrales bacterium]|jgi:hypothetical protein